LFINISVRLYLEWHNNHILNLECLSNEILLQIFEYLDGEELFNAFDNLNSKFKMLIRTQNEKIIFKLSEDNNCLVPDDLFFMLMC
jgi:hypothetical protein